MINPSNKIKFKAAIVFCFFLFLSSISFAAVPKLITYQGILKNSSGSYLTGTYSMTFRIYSAATGGTALWTETQSSVAATSGRFSVQLGSVTALTLDFTSNYWLSVQVGSDGEMTPRQQLTSVGYAYLADNVVNGFTQGQHDALSHKNIQGVRENTTNIAKTNFKLDAYTSASANSMGEMIVDTFNDSTGISAASSSNYTWRGSPNYDVVVAPGGIDSYTKLMLHMNGTSGSTTFTDSETTPKTVTAVGSAQISTAQLKFGSGSGAFNGIGSYLTVPDSSDFDFGTGDFTIDAWVRFADTGTSNTIAGKENSANGWMWIANSATGAIFLYANDFTEVDVTTSFAANVWYHMAVVRNGSNIYFFKDGTLLGTRTASSSGYNGAATTLRVGSRNSGASQLNGWVDELRISKGIARWTAAFTPPAAEYSSVGGSATVVSVAWSETYAPTETMVIPDEVLNTGTITYYVSRDNGTTWTQCTKNTSVDISGQPTGTQVKWKAVLTADSDLKGIAIAV